MKEFVKSRNNDNGSRNMHERDWNGTYSVNVMNATYTLTCKFDDLVVRTYPIVGHIDFAKR